MSEPQTEGRDPRQPREAEESGTVRTGSDRRDAGRSTAGGPGGPDDGRSTGAEPGGPGDGPAAVGEGPVPDGPTGYPPATRRRLFAVALFNGLLFAAIFAGGGVAGSRAAQAIAVDVLNLALSLGLGLHLAARPRPVRSRAALVKAGILGVLGLVVFAGTVIQVAAPRPPAAGLMAACGALGLAGNLATARLLRPLQLEPEIRPLWRFARNGMAGHGAVLLAAATVLGTGTDWPDLIVALNLAVLGLNAALLIRKEARDERRSGTDRGALMSPGHLIAAEALPPDSDGARPGESPPQPQGWRSLAHVP